VSFQPQAFPVDKSNAYRIAFLGESSVNFLQGELNMLRIRLDQALLAHGMRAEIINAGGKSYGSQRLLLVAMELLQYRPDLLVIYMGHNEFEEVEQLELTNLAALPLQRLANHLSIVRVLGDYVLRWRVQQLKAEHEARLLASSVDHGRGWARSYTPAEVSERMSRFRENLEAIVAMYKNRGIPVLIGTIPSNYVRPALPPEASRAYQPVRDLIARGQFDEAYTLGRKVLSSTPGRHQSSSTENRIIRNLAAEWRLPLADVEQAVEEREPHHVPGETLFMDHCHLNSVGNQVLIDAFEQKIDNLLHTRVADKPALAATHSG
jgi:lysophospholipase L1-like esterase